jgi:N-acetylglutamate synthase-like GNAT family acetyltransferase
MNSNQSSLRAFTQKDNYEVTQLINKAFGNSYILSKSNLFELPILLVAVVNSKIVGFCSGDIVSNHVGLLDMLMVHSKFTKQGIGTALFKERMEQFSKMKVTNFTLLHWIKKEQPMPHIAINHGFILKESVPDYWSKASVNINYNCAECGPPPCTCSCAIYTKS